MERRADGRNAGGQLALAMIQGELTNLRAVERSDARFVRDVLNASSVQAGWGTSGAPVSIHLVEHDIEGWIEIERTTRYPAGLIIETLDGAPVGMVLVRQPDRPNQNLASLSIAIEPLSQRQGFGRDALISVIEALFDEWRIHRIQVTCEADNEGAARLYQALGFRLESTRAGATWTGGAFHDQHLFALSASDPRPWLK